MPPDIHTPLHGCVCLATAVKTLKLRNPKVVASNFNRPQEFACRIAVKPLSQLLTAQL
jgi:hypothetical protein